MIYLMFQNYFFRLDVETNTNLSEMRKRLQELVSQSRENNSNLHGLTIQRMANFELDHGNFKSIHFLSTLKMSYVPHLYRC